MSKQIVDWKAALAADAKKLQQANRPEAGYISLKGGRMSYEDKYIDGGLQCIVLASSLIRSYYKDAYQAGVAVPPDCYALGDTASAMVPAENVPSPVSDKCTGCPHAEFPKGGGAPLCKTRARLALIPVSDKTSPAEIAEAQIAQVTLPPTSVREWKSYSGKLGELGLAPWAARTLFTFEGTPAKPWGIATFEGKEPLGKDELLAAAFARIDEANGLVTRQYNYEEKVS